MANTLQERDELISSRLDSQFGSELFIEAAETGKTISKAHLNAIRKFTRTEVAPEDLYVFPVLAIDTKPTRNMVQYSAESQKKSVKKWVGITFLFNREGTNPSLGGADHTLQAASQFARIYKADLVKTPKGETGTLVWVYTVRGVSKEVDEFINKIDAGILREVSIHVMVQKVNCSICDKPFAECEDAHWPGQTYGKQTCYMVTEGAFEPLELSSVACPGSVNAHVMDDEEVGEYALLSLREALGGSREALTQLESMMSQVADDTKCTHEGCTEARAENIEVCESHKAPAPPPAAGTEGVTPPAAVVEKKAASDDPPSDDDGGSGGKKEDDDEEDDDEAAKNKAKKQAFAIFEGDCVACGRGPATESQAPAANTEDLIAELRTETQTRVEQIVTAAKEKVEAAEAKAETAVKSAEAAAEMFADFVKETVEVAIAKGVKEAAAREGYITELSALTYQAVKEVRSVLNASGSKREDKRATLAETAQERARNLNGATQVVTTESGGQKAQTGAKARFGAKIQ